MRKFAIATALVAAAALPAAAVASPSYTYVGAGYVGVDPSGASSLDGFGLEASVELQQNFHLMGNFLRAKDSPLTLQRTRVAGGFNMPVNPTTDFVARLGWSFAKFSVSNVGSNKEDGVFGQIGVRGMVTPDLELNSFLTYDDVEEKVSFDVGGVYNFTPEFSALLGYTYSSSLETWNIGLRYNF